MRFCDYNSTWRLDFSRGRPPDSQVALATNGLHPWVERSAVGASETHGWTENTVSEPG